MCVGGVIQLNTWDCLFEKTWSIIVVNTYVCVLNNYAVPFTLTQHYTAISIKLYLNKTGKPWGPWRVCTDSTLAWDSPDEGCGPWQKEPGGSLEKGIVSDYQEDK